jgi:iron complex transport system substrate-binding protein
LSSALASRPARRVAAAAGALVLGTALTACGSSSESASSSGAPASSTATRTVASAFGQVSVPAQPQRVVALGESALDAALALGVRPVGALAARGGTGVPAYLTELAGPVPIVGTVRETNLEEVVKARPDLILTSAGTTRQQYDALAALAPTVVPVSTGTGEWQAETRAHAEALGRTAQADAVLRELDGRAAALAAQPGLGTATVVRWMPNGPLVMSGSLMAGRLVAASGEKLTAVSAFSDKPHTDPLSLEALGQIDADRLYLATLNADGAKALEEAKASPAFARLTAVQRNRVVTVDGGFWSSSSGPVAADRVLDDIERSRT